MAKVNIVHLHSVHGPLNMHNSITTATPRRNGLAFWPGDGNCITHRTRYLPTRKWGMQRCMELFESRRTAVGYSLGTYVHICILLPILATSLPTRPLGPLDRSAALSRSSLRRCDAPLHELLPSPLDERPPREPAHVHIHEHHVPRRACGEPRRARRSGPVAMPDDRA